MENNSSTQNEKELNILDRFTNIIPLLNNPLTVLFVINNTISLYEFPESNLEKFKLLHNFTYTDSILQILPFEISSNEFIVVGKSNKKIEIVKLNQDNKTIEVKYSYTHQKKLTSMFEIKEDKDKFLFFSDKFGEITIKKITPEETTESFEKKGKIISGHCDLITFLNISQNNKLLFSTDSFGKIKIYEFPNMFNVLSVLLYPNEGIKYCNFIGEHDKALLVLTNTNEIHTWSMYDFVLQKKKQIDIDGNEKVISITMNKEQKEFILETTKKFVVYEVSDFTFEIKDTKTINKEENDKDLLVKVFYLENKRNVAYFDKENSIKKIISIN